MKVNLFAEYSAEPYATNVELIEVFPEPFDFEWCGAMLESDGVVYAGGGASPRIRIEVQSWEGL